MVYWYYPDSTNVPGAEAKQWITGHGFPTAVGIALGLKIKDMSIKLMVLLVMVSQEGMIQSHQYCIKQKFR